MFKKAHTIPLALVGVGLLLATPCLALAAPQSASPPPTENQERSPFPDVPKDHWAAPAVNRLAASGIVEGKPNGKFDGNAPLTRYEFAVAIIRLFPTCLLPQENFLATPEAEAPPPPLQPATTGKSQNQLPPGSQKADANSPR